MDGYGIAIFVVGIVAFYVLRKRTPDFAVFCMWVSGIGAGIFIGAIWAYMIISGVLDNFFSMY